MGYGEVFIVLVAGYALMQNVLAFIESGRMGKLFIIATIGTAIYIIKNFYSIEILFYCSAGCLITGTAMLMYQKYKEHFFN